MNDLQKSNKSNSENTPINKGERYTEEEVDAIMHHTLTDGETANKLERTKHGVNSKRYYENHRDEILAATTERVITHQHKRLEVIVSGNVKELNRINELDILTGLSRRLKNRQ